MKIVSKHIKKIKNINGFTLVEIITVMGIVTIVAAMLFSLLVFGNNTFRKSEKQSNLQSSISQAMNLIKNSVQYATELEIGDTFTQPVPNTGRYSYINVLEKSIEFFFYDSITGNYKDKVSVTIADKQGSFTTISNSFKYNTDIDNNYKFNIEINGTNGINNEYIYSTEFIMILDNMKLSGMGINGTSSGNAIKYRYNEIPVITSEAGYNLSSSGYYSLQMDSSVTPVTWSVISTTGKDPDWVTITPEGLLKTYNTFHSDVVKVKAVSEENPAYYGVKNVTIAP